MEQDYVYNLPLIPRKMKIAYLISAYKDPNQLGRMIRALYVEGSTRFFIHVDVKSSVGSFEQSVNPEYRPYVEFTKKRYWVQWGGYNQVRYQQALLQSCIESGVDFDRVFILTAQDYPLWSNEKIVRELESHPAKEYIRGLDVSNLSMPKYHEKIVLYHFFRDMYHVPYKLKKIFSGGGERL